MGLGLQTRGKAIQLMIPPPPVGLALSINICPFSVPMVWHSSTKTFVIDLGHVELRSHQSLESAPGKQVN